MRTAREVLVIGGNRYFGKRLIARLLAAGDRVTVLNRGSSPRHRAWSISSPTGTTRSP